jgi:hypothetical protein
MKTIDLSMYKEFKYYFPIFDVLIKKESNNKEMWLEENDISPSSYRRAKNDGNKIGHEILKTLCDKMSYKMITENFIDEIEQKINVIYFNTYYRKTDLYESDFQWIEEQIKENYIIYPIFLLFKLLLIVNSKIDPKRILTEYNALYNELNKYLYFFNDDLMRVYEIISISFIDEINIDVLSKDYKNEITFFTLSSKCILEGKYIESIYFAEKAKKFFIKEENAKRIYLMNLNLMSAYNYLGRYNDCNILAQKQILALESYKCSEIEYTAAKKHYMISCLGVGKYQEVINELKDKEGYTLTEFCCLLISKFKVNRKDYDDYYSSLIISKNISENHKIFFESLNKLLVKKDKKAIEILEKYTITKSLIKFFKKM